MSEEQRDFKGIWIPKEVWLDRRLNALDKIILAEIDSLDNGERGCYASNKYIAEFCQCSEKKVSTSISLLIKLDYLYVQSFDGRTRELRSRLSNFARQTSKKCKADFTNLRDNNIDNNIDIDIEVSKQEQKPKPKRNSFDEIIEVYTQDEEIRQLLREWIKVRKAKRAAMTDAAIQMNISKLDRLAAQSEMTDKQYLEEIICRGWNAFFPIPKFGNGNNGSNNNGSAQTKKQDTAQKEYSFELSDLENLMNKF